MFKVERIGGTFASGIEEEGKLILHLQEGTVLNEENIERVVALLNRKAEVEDTPAGE